MKQASSFHSRSTPFNLKVRKETRFDFEGVSAIHTADNRYISHFFNALSLITPITEGILIRAVRKAQPLLEGSGLEDDAKAFIGQEAVHTREHRALNTHLKSIGYGAESAIAILNNHVAKLEEKLTLQDALAIVVAGEHAIYSISRVLLQIPHERYMQHEEVRRLFLWHSLEEMEHQSVCDDIYRKLYGAGLKHNVVYLRAFSRATKLLYKMIGSVMGELLKTSRAGKKGELKAFISWLTIDPALGIKTAAELMAFFKPGFKHWSRKREDLELINGCLEFVYPG